jgi:hypothetical protein
MSKTYVIAGTNQEAQAWIAKNYQERVAIGDQQVSTRDYVYVASKDSLAGVRDPHGVFVGNWLGRPDIFEIVQELMLKSTHVNAALGKIYKELHPKIRPTPKQPITYNQVIADAADALSKHIDQALLDEITKKINEDISVSSRIG